MLVVIGLMALAPAAAQAGAGASATIGFVPGTVTVGASGTGTLRLTNGNTTDIGVNTDGVQTNTVCNFGDVAPPCEPAIGAPAADRGIQLVPACKAPSGGLCPAGSEDPGVFSITGMGTGAGACVGVSFTITPLNDAFGTYRFTPTVGRVQLPGPDVAPPSTPQCAISFPFTVLKSPANGVPVAGGIATGQATLHTQYIGTAVPGNPAAKNAFGRGTNNLGTTIVKAGPPPITTVASPDVPLGGALTDQATITTLVNPVAGATVQFDLYAPGNTTCTGAPVFTNTKVVTLAGSTATATSDPFTPTLAGTYRWVARYSGDANNFGVDGVCGVASETRDITRIVPVITTVASGNIVVGGQLTDQATVSGLVNPIAGSTVTFDLYPPSAGTTCAGAPVFSQTVGTTLGGGGTTATATSPPYTPVLVGTYRWRATFSGDTNNTPISGACNIASETRDVTKASPAIATGASGNIVLGAGTLTDTATVTGRVSPDASGTVTFRLYGPDNATCAGAALFTSAAVAYPVAGGAVTSAPAFTPTAAGVYRWVATYSGDNNNNAVSGACSDANESVTVAPPGTTPPPPTPPCTEPPGTPPPGGSVCVHPPPPCTEPPTPVPPGGTRCVHPPEACTTPPGPAPAGGELCARGTAAIRGVTGCAGTLFRVVVRGSQIETVVYALDGKVISTLRKPNRGVLFVLPVNPRLLPQGVHRVIARTVFRKQSGTRARVLRVTFSRCGRRAVSPAFTG